MDDGEAESQKSLNAGKVDEEAQQHTGSEVENRVSDERPDIHVNDGNGDDTQGKGQQAAEKADKPSWQNKGSDLEEARNRSSAEEGEVDHDVDVDNPVNSGPEEVDHDVDMNNLDNTEDNGDDSGRNKSTEKGDHSVYKDKSSKVERSEDNDSSSSSSSEDLEEVDHNANNDNVDTGKKNSDNKKREDLVLRPRGVEKRKREGNSLH